MLDNIILFVGLPRNKKGNQFFAMLKLKLKLKFNKVVQRGSAGGLAKGLSIGYTA
jgi:hypothetical protein